MKTLLLIATLISLTTLSGTKIEDCKCKQIPLYGRVKIVDSFADFNVQMVNSFADLNVQKVESFPDQCGKWQIVESFPDFTIKLVTSHPDFTIKYVTSHPGVN